MPADGKPIMLLSDHGALWIPKTRSGYKRWYDKLVQIPPGSKVKFKEIELRMLKICIKYIIWKQTIFLIKLCNQKLKNFLKKK